MGQTMPTGRGWPRLPKIAGIILGLSLISVPETARAMSNDAMAPGTPPQKLPPKKGGVETVKRGLGERCISDSDCLVGKCILVSGVTRQCGLPQEKQTGGGGTFGTASMVAMTSTYEDGELWPISSPASADTKQGTLQSCWLLAALAGASHTGQLPTDAVEKLASGDYRVSFYNLDDPSERLGIVVGPDLLSHPETEAHPPRGVYLRDLDSDARLELAPALVEKAAGHYEDTIGHSIDGWGVYEDTTVQFPWSALAAGYPDLAITALTGRPTSWIELAELGDADMRVLLSAADRETVVAATKSDASSHLSWLTNDHAYTVLDLVSVNSGRLVALRDVWANIPGLDANAQRDGVFLMDLETFRQTFKDLSYTVDATNGDGAARSFGSITAALDHYHSASLGGQPPSRTPLHDLEIGRVKLPTSRLKRADGSAFARNRQTLLLLVNRAPTKRELAKLADLERRAKKAGYEVAWVARPGTAPTAFAGRTVNVDRKNRVFRGLKLKSKKGLSPGFATVRGSRVTARGVSALVFLERLGVKRKRPIGIDAVRPGGPTGPKTHKKVRPKPKKKRVPRKPRRP
jgi:hypothetical protein